MKKKIVLISLPVLAVILTAVIIIGNAFSARITASDIDGLKPDISVSDEKWIAVESGITELKNGDCVLRLDTATGHFTVTNGKGAIYSSVAAASDAEGKKQSELILNYYDSNSTLATMNSFKNSVENGNFQVKTDGKAIRVTYSVQKSKVRIFVPKVLTKKTFEEITTENLNSGERRRLKLFYTLYEPESKDAKTKKMKSQYKALEKTALYILNDSASGSILEEITGYMDKAGYKSEDYEKELKQLGTDESADGNLPAGFSVTVEYSLNSGGFSAEILNDRITSESSGYTLTDMDLLPYFGCAENKSEGFMLVPDGSGAIIDLSEKHGVNYTQRIYGNDQAIEKDRQSAVVQNVGMPVFGMNSKDKAFLAVIEGGEAAATVNAEVFGDEYTESRIYSEFSCKAVDSSNAGQLRRQGSVNLYPENYSAENPKVTYILCDGGVTYGKMAELLREKLIDDGALKEKLKKSSLLYLDFTGYETAAASVLGISVNKQIFLSDYDGIIKSLDELKGAGVTGVTVRLKAYGNGGLYPTVQNGLKLNKKVITETELKALAERLNSENGALYLENNISTVFREGEGFKKMTHAARGLKKTVVKGIDYDLVARTDSEASNSFLMTSPVYFKSLTESFIKSFGEKTGDCSLYGYSRSDYGSKLWSDFNDNLQIDRCISAKLASEAAGHAKNEFSGVMTDGSNSYALENADILLNVPLTSSNFSCESYSVPFYQMVLHGYKSFAGGAMNISQNSAENYLNSVESGASLYFSCYTNGGASIKETRMGTLTYPTVFSGQSEIISEYYKIFEKLFGDLYDKTITEHTRVSDTLTVTTYENGKQIVVNYGDSDAVYNGITVPASGFAEVGK